MLSDLCFFVPARASSQRVKSKNIKPFCNSTLIEIKLTQIKRAFPNSYLVFDTDSQEYIDRVNHLCDRSTLRHSFVFTIDSKRLSNPLICNGLINLSIAVIVQGSLQLSIAIHN